MKLGPVVRFAFLMPDGDTYVRDWGIDDNPPRLLSPPDWLEGAWKEWPNPQDPITFSGTVVAGHEVEAMAVLEERDRG